LWKILSPYKREIAVQILLIDDSMCHNGCVVDGMGPIEASSWEPGDATSSNGNTPKMFRGMFWFYTEDETGCAVPVTVELDFFSSSYLDMVVLLLSQMIW
jgi:hypothetical protein